MEKITYEQLEKWIDMVNKIKFGRTYERIYNNSEVLGIEDVTKWLLENHYIGIMGDGNCFISWTTNRFNSSCTIMNLKRELANDDQ